MKIATFFVSRTRVSGDSFVGLRDDAPTWLSDAVRAAHGDSLPRDWIYARCLDVALALDDGTIGGASDVHAFVDAAVDVDAADRFAWAADMHGTDLFADAEELEHDSAHDTIADRLGAIQFWVLDGIAHTLLSAWLANASTEDES